MPINKYFPKCIWENYFDFKEKLSQCALIHQKKGREPCKIITWQEEHSEQFKSL